MKRIFLAGFPIWLAVFISGEPVANAQVFQNLNFEGKWSNGQIPGWTANWYNEYTDLNLPVGSTSYIEPSSGYNLDVNTMQLVNNSGPNGMSPIQGNQSLFLEATPTGDSDEVSISQTGTVPVGTQSLTFLVQNPWYTTPSANNVNDAPELAVSFAGNELVLEPLSNPDVAGVVEYSANISAYAGISGTLSISAVDGPNQKFSIPFILAGIGTGFHFVGCSQ